MDQSLLKYVCSCDFFSSLKWFLNPYVDCLSLWNRSRLKPNLYQFCIKRTPKFSLKLINFEFYRVPFSKDAHCTNALCEILFCFSSEITFENDRFKTRDYMQYLFKIPWKCTSINEIQKQDKYFANSFLIIYSLQFPWIFGHFHKSKRDFYYPWIISRSRSYTVSQRKMYFFKSKLHGENALVD